MEFSELYLKPHSHAYILIIYAYFHDHENMNVVSIVVCDDNHLPGK